MSQKEDQFYITKVLNGDEKVYSFLIDRYKYMVFTLAFKMLKNREDAEEVAQDTFVKAYHSLATFKGESKFSTWLYRIAYYGCLDVLKKENRRLTTISIENDHDINLAEIVGVLNQFETQNRTVVIKESLDELTSEEAILVRLHYFDELSLNEMAKVVDLPTNTIKVRLFRVRKKLAIILEKKLTPETIKSYGRK